MHHPKIEELLRRDPRYPVEAYEFIDSALKHTQKMLGRGQDEELHVSGPQLLLGVRDLALREFGLMARAVFRMWGINRTDDFGEIVFNLVEENLMSKTDEDTRKDFHEVFDMDRDLLEGYQIRLEDADQ
jgi:uncharacterized repeat protein (TIGR04138 family)